MARPKTNDIAVHEFGKAIRAVTRGSKATPKDIELWTHANFQVRVSEESVRKALRGDIDPTACSAELLLALARYFEVEPAALGTHAARKISGIMALANTEGARDLPIARNRCRVQFADVIDLRSRGSFVDDGARAS